MIHVYLTCTGRRTGGFYAFQWAQRQARKGQIERRANATEVDGRGAVQEMSKKNRLIISLAMMSLSLVQESPGEDDFLALLGTRGDMYLIPIAGHWPYFSRITGQTRIFRLNGR